MNDPAMNARPTALVAEDEPLLARTLVRLLGEVWPELDVVAMAADGIAASELALRHTPDVIFLDIAMPGRSGLDVAAAVADDWPDERAEPLFVFVTAFDAFAVAAFERAATDYVLKPATAERLRLTAGRLIQRLAARTASSSDGAMAGVVERMQAISAPSPGSADRAPIRVIRAGVGNTVRMIPVADVICFEATDKYVNVVTAAGEALVRMSLRELIARIDGADFMQVHRSVMVNSRLIDSATRDENGHYSLSLKGLKRPIRVSRAFGHLFRPM